MLSAAKTALRMPSSVASVSSSSLCAKLEDQRAIHTLGEGEIEGVEGATRIANHRSLALVDLDFLAGPRVNDAGRLRREPAAHAPRIAPHAGIATGEAVLVDQVLPPQSRRWPPSQ